MPKSENPLESVELDQVVALLDRSLSDATKAVAKAQSSLRQAHTIARAIREQSGKIRTISDKFRLQLGPAIREEAARASQRPVAG